MTPAVTTAILAALDCMAPGEDIRPRVLARLSASGPAGLAAEALIPVATRVAARVWVALAQLAVEGVVELGPDGRWRLSTRGVAAVRLEQERGAAEARRSAKAIADMIEADELESAVIAEAQDREVFGHAVVDAAKALHLNAPMLLYYFTVMGDGQKAEARCVGCAATASLDRITQIQHQRDCPRRPAA